ncbi:hypothetical protein JOM56_007060, partial [Amanita muscaria]
MSPQVPKSATSTSGGNFDFLWSPSLYPQAVVAAVITITFSLIFFRQLCKTTKKSREKDILIRRQPARDGRTGKRSIDHSPGGRNEDYHGSPIETEMPLVTPEHSSIDREGRDVQKSREARHGVDPDFPFPTEAPSAAIIRSGDGQFTDIQRHTQIATRCFEIMNKHLKRNILGLGDPARFMNNEDGLKEDGITDEQIQEKITQQLRYACIHWANHLEVADIEDEALMDG